MKINLRLKIGLSFLMSLALAGVLYFVMEQNANQVPTEDVIGEIQFRLYDESESLVVDEVLAVYDNDNLFSLLNRHFVLVCANQYYQPDDTCSYKFVHGYALLGVESVITDWHSNYLSIYVNDEISVLGVSGIEPVDGDVIEIKVIRDE